MSRARRSFSVGALIAAVAWLSTAPRAQGVDEARVREVLAFLGADDRAGRDTPSPGLDQAAEFLVSGFAAAGLKPGGDDGGWYHVYRQPGLRLDRGGVRLTARVDGPADGEPAGAPVTLRPIADVRLWRASGAFEVEDGEVLRVQAEDAEPLRRRLRGSKPVLIEVGEDSALWRACAAPVADVLRGRRTGPPWLLVRRGALPPGSLRVGLSVPAPEEREFELRNVVARLDGDGARRDEVVLVTAHYDHVGVGVPVDGDAVYNGADDNGTGTTAVLTLAEALARRVARGGPLSRTLVFVCFSGEERGLLGSRAFAERPSVPLDKVAAQVNLEMLGRPWQPSTLWVTGRALSDFESILAGPAGAADVQVAPFPQEAMLFGASDNWPLAQKGVVAHSISASALHQDYHRPSDEVGRIDIANMTGLLRGLEAFLVELADRARWPVYDADGIARLRLPRRDL